jgi:threonine synthase
MTEILCTNCRRPYPEQGAVFRCQTCTGLFDYAAPPGFDLARLEAGEPRMWRYRHTFGLPLEAPRVSLGEGDTPLVWAEAFGREIAFKLEYLNPTGSFKDRGSAVLVSFLRSRGVQSAVEDSSGNAGASFAAYAARAGMEATVFVPAYASGPKRNQIEAFGAKVVLVEGSRSKTSEAVLKAVQDGEVYASHGYMPHGLAGYATIAYEIFSDLGGLPGAVLAPVGQGNLLLSIGRGFLALKEAGLTAGMPKLVGVQALACAPIWALYQYGPAGLGMVVEGETMAEGIRVRHPLRGDAVLQIVAASDGALLAVDEQEILAGQERLAKLGFYVEPTSAIVWGALEQVIDELPDPIVVVLTGSGLKTR